MIPKEKTMPKKLIFLSCALVVLIILGFIWRESGPKLPEAPKTSGFPMKLARYYWPGQFWKEIAYQKGWFKEAGLKVELIDTNSDYYASLVDMVDGKMDSNSFTSFDLIQFNLKGADLVAVINPDISHGVDAIIAKREIDDISGLRGKKIGVTLGTYSEYLLNVVVSIGGLTPDEVVKVNVLTERAVKDFINGTLDAIVTWEPLAAEARKKGNGRTLFDTSQSPGIVASVTAFKRSFIKKRPHDVQACVNVWHRTIQFIKENPEEAFGIIAAIYNVSLDEVKVLANLDKIMDLDHNITAFTYGAGFDSLYGGARQVVVITITALLIMSMFVYFISKRLTEPIMALTRKVKIFSSGNLSTRILVTTKDEVGYLGTSFNEMAANIEKSVKEREQTQKTLQRAKVSAEAATRAKSEFLANVSHELRTPMNSIVGMNYLLKETELTSQQKEYLDETDQASRKLQEILNNILDFSRIDQDETIMGATRFDLNDVLTKIVDQADTKAREKGLTLRLDTNPEIPTILEGNPERLGQVLHHLLDNAIKFTEEGSVTLGVSSPQPSVSDHPHSTQHPESIIRLRFEVVDTGIGIPREQVEDLFQPFTQLYGSSTRKYGGIGLGLSACKRLAELMEGEVSVNSEVGKGSTSSFTAKFGCIPDDSLQAVGKSAGERADIEGTEVLSNASRQKDIENLAPRLQELAGLLKINDMRAETVFSEIKEKLHAVIPAETNELKQKLDNFDFKGALNRLVAIAEFLNILLEKGTDT